MSQSILFMCARSGKENLLSALFNYRYYYRNKIIYIREKKHQNTYITLIIYIEKRTDNVTFSPEVIEFMIDPNQHS